MVAVGHLEEDADGPLIRGHLLDVTEFRQDAVRAEVDQAVQDCNAHRAMIEQAKGVLMQLYSVNADLAWHMLRAYSQSHRRKVRDVAQALVNAAQCDGTPSKHFRGAVHEVIDSLLAGGL